MVYVRDFLIAEPIVCVSLYVFLFFVHTRFQLRIGISRSTAKFDQHKLYNIGQLEFKLHTITPPPLNRTAGLLAMAEGKDLVN